MPTLYGSIEIRNLEKDLRKFHSVSLILQKKDGEINLHDVRCMFDQLIRDFSDDFAYYLSENSTIVNNPEFEKAIAKYIKNPSSLSEEDIIVLKCLELETGTVSNSEDMYLEDVDYASSAINALKKKIERSYVDLTKILGET